MSGCTCAGGGVTFGCVILGCVGACVTLCSGIGVGATFSTGVASTAVFCAALAELLAPPKLPASHSSTSVGCGAAHFAPHHSTPSTNACSSTVASIDGLCKVLVGVAVRLKYMGNSFVRFSVAQSHVIAFIERLGFVLTAGRRAQSGRI